MKKIISMIIGFLILIVGINLGISKKIIAITNEDSVLKEEDLIEEISNKLIRFHVLANSNTDIDQKLKMKVKDDVINFISPKLKDVQTLDEARIVLLENDNEIISIADKCIRDNGYDYVVTTEIGRENFPEKVYGNITLPQGEYEAYRILIGNAKGENWWCVMFPPLCFVDVTKGQISYNETEEKMKDVLSEEEYKIVSNNNELKEKKDKETKNKKDEEITFKLKVFDLFKKRN